MTKYELTIVLPGKDTTTKQKKILAKIEKTITDTGGKIGKMQDWGKKSLAYSIKKQEEGCYFFLPLDLAPEEVLGIIRTIENDEDVLRYLLVKEK